MVPLLAQFVKNAATTKSNSIYFNFFIFKNKEGTK
jgi:hypothetical protein